MSMKKKFTMQLFNSGLDLFVPLLSQSSQIQLSETQYHCLHIEKFELVRSLSILGDVLDQWLNTVTAFLSLCRCILCCRGLQKHKHKIRRLTILTSTSSNLSIIQLNQPLSTTSTQSILDLIWSGCDLAEDGEEKGAACGEYLSEVQGAMRDFCKGPTLNDFTQIFAFQSLSQPRNLSVLSSRFGQPSPPLDRA